MPDHPPLFIQTKPHVSACVPQVLLSQSLLLLKVDPLLHAHVNGVHSDAFVHDSPGAFGPGGPASGFGVVAVPDQPP